MSEVRTGARPDAHPALVGRHVVLIREVRADGVDADGPDVAELARDLRAAGARVKVVTCASVLKDLFGRRVVGRPDVVIGVLPGRGPALSAQRFAERLDIPLMVLLNADDAPSWGEGGTLRRADRVLITREDLRPRVLAAGARPDRVDRWHWLAPGALAGFRRAVVATLTQHLATPAAGLSTGVPRARTSSENA